MTRLKRVFFGTKHGVPCRARHRTRKTRQLRIALHDWSASVCGHGPQFEGGGGGQPRFRRYHWHWQRHALGLGRFPALVRVPTRIPSFFSSQQHSTFAPGSSSRHHVGFFSSIQLVLDQSFIIISTSLDPNLLALRKRSPSTSRQSRSRCQDRVCRGRRHGVATGAVRGDDSGHEESFQETGIW